MGCCEEGWAGREGIGCGMSSVCKMTCVVCTKERGGPCDVCISVTEVWRVR